MLKKLGSKITEFLKMLFLFKPEESFKEVFESLDYLDKELDNIYFSSFEVGTLFEYYVNKDRLAEMEEEIKKYSDMIDVVDKDNYRLSVLIAKNLLIFCCLFYGSVFMGALGLNFLISIIMLLANFFVAYRFAVVSDKLVEVIKEDKKSKNILLNTIERMGITCGNISRNLDKKKSLLEANTTSKPMAMDVWEKAQEALNNYLDYGSFTMMSDEVILYLKKMLQEDLNVEEENIFALLDLAKERNLETKNLNLPKNLNLKKGN